MDSFKENDLEKFRTKALESEKIRLTIAIENTTKLEERLRASGGDLQGVQRDRLNYEEQLKRVNAELKRRGGSPSGE